MLSGTFCRSSLRFSAVTTTVSIASAARAVCTPTRAVDASNAVKNIGRERPCDVKSPIITPRSATARGHVSLLSQNCQARGDLQGIARRVASATRLILRPILRGSRFGLENRHFRIGLEHRAECRLQWPQPLLIVAPLLHRVGENGLANLFRAC